MIVVIDKDSLFADNGLWRISKPLEEIDHVDIVDGVHLTMDGYRHAQLILVVDSETKRFRCLKDMSGAFNTSGEFVYEASQLKNLLGRYPAWIWFGWGDLL